PAHCNVGAPTAPARTAAPGTTDTPKTARTRSAPHRRTGPCFGPAWPLPAGVGACCRGTWPARRDRPWPAPCLPCARRGRLFFQEGGDLGEAAADAGQAFDGLLGLAGAARRVLQEVVLQGALMLVQFAGRALPVEAADLVEAAGLELVEVALHGAWRDIGQRGDLGVGQALALQPQHLHLALDAGMGMVVAVVANLRQDFRADGERTHGCRSATEQRASNRAVGIRPSCGNSANLSRGKYTSTATPRSA